MARRMLPPPGHLDLGLIDSHFNEACAKAPSEVNQYRCIRNTIAHAWEGLSLSNKGLAVQIFQAMIASLEPVALTQTPRELYYLWVVSLQSHSSARTLRVHRRLTRAARAKPAVDDVCRELSIQVEDDRHPSGSPSALALSRSASPSRSLSHDGAVMTMRKRSLYFS